MNRQKVLLIANVVGFFGCLQYSLFAQNQAITDSLTLPKCELRLDGTNERLIDNAIKCFDLNSIGSYGDSSYRLWHLTRPYENKNIVRLRMFELGVKNGKRIAAVYTLEWRPVGSTLKVASNYKKKLIPKNGWQSVDTFFKEYRLEHLRNLEYGYPLNSSGVTFGLQMIQFVSWSSVRTYDFTMDAGPPAVAPKSYLYAFYLLILKNFPGSFFPDLGEEGEKWMEEQFRGLPSGN